MTAEPAEDGADAGQLLASAGIELFADRPDRPEFVAAWAECLRVAQRMLRRGCRTIGLLPASAEVGAVGIGLNLTVALRDLSGKSTAYVDANLRWPALGLRSTQPPRVPALGAHGGGAAASLFARSWLRNDVALLLPRHRMLTGAGLAPLRALLDEAEQQYGACIVDLTGWKRLGDHLSVFELLDGVAVVARVGVTSELELLRLRYEIPADRYLGIVLTGATVQT